MIDATKTIERARRKLGHPVIQIEITDEQMTSLIKDAQETFYLYADLSNMPIDKQEKIEDAWIKKYFFALCKETLGRIRGKFGGAIPVPGTDLKLDYESLLLESERERAFLKYSIFGDEEILKSVRIKDAVFVFYVNVVNLDVQETSEQMELLMEKFKKPGFINYFIPVEDSESRVECIYPVSDEFDEEGKHIIDRLSDYLDELTNNNKTNNQELIGKKFSLDLGGIGPSSYEIVVLTDTKVGLKSSPGNKHIELTRDEFETVSGIKIKKDEKQD